MSYHVSPFATEVEVVTPCRVQRQRKVYPGVDHEQVAGDWRPNNFRIFGS